MDDFIETFLVPYDNMCPCPVTGALATGRFSGGHDCRQQCVCPSLKLLITQEVKSVQMEGFDEYSHPEASVPRRWYSERLFSDYDHRLAYGYSADHPPPSVGQTVDQQCICRMRPESFSGYKNRRERRYFNGSFWVTEIVSTEREGPYTGDWPMQCERDNNCDCFTTQTEVLADGSSEIVSPTHGISRHRMVRTVLIPAAGWFGNCRNHTVIGDWLNNELRETRLQGEVITEEEVIEAATATQSTHVTASGLFAGWQIRTGRAFTWGRIASISLQLSGLVEGVEYEIRLALREGAWVVGQTVSYTPVEVEWLRFTATAEDAEGGKIIEAGPIEPVRGTRTDLLGAELRIVSPEED